MKAVIHTIIDFSIFAASMKFLNNILRLPFFSTYYYPVVAGDRYALYYTD
ncbi:hypothetical protein [Aridibaculum aurantiacum]|nr:hypothetical protein [Aridibaculum aurantiacum]